MIALAELMLEGGEAVAPGIGSDIAKPGVERVGLSRPRRIEAALSLFAGAAEVEAALESVGCPVLVFTSVEDHVVDPALE